MSAIQAVRDALDTSNADQKKQQEQLDFLLSMAQSKMQLYTMDLTTELRGEGGTNPIHIVGDPIGFEEAYSCNVSSTANDGIMAAVNSFFGGSSDDVKKGFQTLISVGLQAILGNSSMGESEQIQTFVTMEHNAVIRVDVKAWRYNFSDKGVIATIQNAFCYVFCKSVVDHSKVSIDTLTYLISQQAGDNPDVAAAYIAALKKIWDDLKPVTPATVRTRFAVAAASLQPQLVGAR
jgi:hypothetical protein